MHKPKTGGNVKLDGKTRRDSGTSRLNSTSLFLTVKKHTTKVPSYQAVEDQKKNKNLILLTQNK